MAHARQSVVAMGDLDDIWSNQFWSGPESPGMEAGVDVVLARLKSGTRALEDLRAFYKERASIEEEYSKRLSRLARQPLGRDETGTMRAALDRVRQETAKAGDAHDKLAHMVRTALEVKAKEFEQGRDQKRRNVGTSFHPGSAQLTLKTPQSQAAIEKSLKNKANQEAMVVKAREKYKADCVAINGYTG